MSTDQIKAIGQTVFNRAGGILTNRRLPGLAMLLALALLSHSLANLTWKLVPIPETVGSGVSMPTMTSAERIVPQQDQPVAGQISQWHLFGEYVIKTEPPKPVQEVETAPVTRLNLKLLGVFASTNDFNARAIIADAKGKEESYKIGEQVPGGATLHKVFNDRVILDRNGRLETLQLPVDIPPSEGGDGGPVAGVQTSSVPPPTSRPAQVVSNVEAGTRLKEIRDKLVSDPQSVMGLVRAEPFRKNGKLAGYRIRPGKDRQLLRQFGLRSGDVVTAINGVPMDNPLKALELMRDLSSATSLTVDIERRGVPQSFSFSIP